MHRMLNPLQFAFCSAVFEDQESFSESSLYSQSRQSIHASLLKHVKACGADVNAVQKSIEMHNVDKNRLWRTVQLDVLFAIQNGIRSCPTVTVNGLVDFFPTSSWSVG